jgi:hypothetical protein
MQHNESVGELKERVLLKTGFLPMNILKEGVYYDSSHVRDFVIKGVFGDSEAVLKCWIDPRPVFEPTMLIEMSHIFEGTRFRTPKVLSYEMETLFKGWMITEYVKVGNFDRFPSHLSSSDQRRCFLEIYNEYRESFPSVSPLNPAMHLPIESCNAGVFHSMRISRWYGLAQEYCLKHSDENYFTIFDLNKFFEKAFDKIYNYFLSVPMQWSHGHFKPDELLISKNTSEIYLFDFAHVKHYPLGYELAFIIWSDACMSMDAWLLDYDAWDEYVETWIHDVANFSLLEGWERDDFLCLLHISMLERLVGTLMADVISTDMLQVAEKKRRIEYLLRLGNQLLNTL